MTNFVLVRHGETVWHAENRYAGTTDVALTDRGREQARRLALWAATTDLDGIWCSTLTRARETAEIAASATGHAAHVDGRLVELDFGRGEGLTSAEMQERFPAQLEAFRADPATHPLPGGEDPHRAVDRALACLGDIADEHPEGRILVVAHTTLLRLTLCRLIGVALGEYRRLFPFVRNGAVTEVTFGDGRPALLQFNTPLEPIARAEPESVPEPAPPSASR